MPKLPCGEGGCIMNHCIPVDCYGCVRVYLQTRAGRSVYDAILRHSGPSSPRHITVLAGKVGILMYAGYVIV